MEIKVTSLDGKEAGISCFTDPMTMKADAKNCVLGDIANPYAGTGTEAAAMKAIEKIRMAGVAGNVQWDQVVARLDGAELALTVREFDLLVHLMRHPGRAFRRASKYPTKPG